MPGTTAQTSTPVPERVAAALKPFYQQTLVWTSCARRQAVHHGEGAARLDEPGGRPDLARAHPPDGQGDQAGLAARQSGRPRRLRLRLRQRLRRLRDRRDPAAALRRGRLRPPRGRPLHRGQVLRPEADGRLPLRHHARACAAPTSGSPRTSPSPKTSATPARRTRAASSRTSTPSARPATSICCAPSLGDTKLNYLGYSYGTYLGAVYAELYPGKTGRLVLDGALDPAATNDEVTTVQAKGFESALRAYLKDCLSTEGLPVHRHGRRRDARPSPSCSRRWSRAPSATPTAASSAPTRCSRRSSTRSTTRPRGRT